MTTSSSSLEFTESFWCELPAQIAFKHLSLLHIRREGAMRGDVQREGGKEGEGDQQVCAEPSSADNIL